MTFRSAVGVIVLGAALAVPLRAQVVADRARLSVGVGLGFNGGGNVWRLGNQPIIDQGGLVDSVALGRRITPQLGVSLTATYFPNDYFGWVGEVQFLGLHYEDDCTLQTARSAEAQSICANVRGRQHDGTSVVIAGGGIFRPIPHGAISPYLRGNVGMSVSLNSSVRTIGTWVDSASEENDYYLLGDPNPREMTPVLSFGAGFTSFIGPGSQLRFEVRDNVVFLEHPLAPQLTPDPNAAPVTGLRASHLFALSVSFEIVLEKRRGRRY